MYRICKYFFPSCRFSFHFFFLFTFFFKDFIYLFMIDRERERQREREREAETQAEGGAGSLQGVWHGSRSWDSRILSWNFKSILCPLGTSTCETSQSFILGLHQIFHQRLCILLFSRAYLDLYIINEKSTLLSGVGHCYNTHCAGDPWVAQRFSACLRPRAWSWSPRIKSRIRLPAWSLLLPLPMSLPLSLFLCVSHE